MAFNWIQSKLKKQKKGKDEAPQPVVAHKATKTVFGPTPWTIWFDSGLELVCEEGKDEGRTIPLEYGFLVVGRGLSTDEQRNGWLLFVEDTVSRRQAVLCWNEERDSYYLFHLKGTTNGTYVDRRSGKQWRVGVGSTVEMGYLRYRFQRRLPNWKTSAFVVNTLDRLGLGPEDAPVKTGLALTIIDGERKGNTFILSRRYHIMHKTPNGDGLLQRGQHQDLEHDLLVWNEDAQTYMLLHNPHASAPTYVHAGRPTATFNIFAPIPESCVEVVSDSPLILRDGDTIRIGGLHVRLHRHIQPLLEGSISHIMQKGYIEKIPTVDVMLENVTSSHTPEDPAGVLEAAAAEPPDDDSGEYEYVEVSDSGEHARVPEPEPQEPMPAQPGGGWVDPDQAPPGEAWTHHEPTPSFEPDETQAPARRVSRVAPGKISPAGAEVDGPRRKPRTTTAVTRVAPTDEPLPFDPVEAAPPPAFDRGGRKARHSTHERETHPEEAREAPVRPVEAAPVEAPPLAVAAVAEEAPRPRTVPETPPPAPRAQTPAARPAPSAPRPSQAPRREERPAADSDRRLSLSVSPRKAAEAAPAAPAPAAAAAATTEGIEQYQLEAVTMAGMNAGDTVVRVTVSEQPTLVIGAAETCDLRLAGDTGLAGSHAIIEATERGLVLRPIDGMPMVNKSICVKETLLRDGDEIRLTRNSLLRLRAL